MARLKTLKTNFTSGEISGDLLGRGDLSAYSNGAGKLENVRVLPTGGVTRRDGTVYIDELNGEARFLEFEFNSQQVYLVALLEGRIRIYSEDAGVVYLEADISGTPWGVADFAQLNWAQSADTLLIVHPEIPPYEVIRQGVGDWVVQPWRFRKADDGTGIVYQPFYKYVPDNVTISMVGSLTGKDFTVEMSEPFFTSEYLGRHLLVNGMQVAVLSIIDARQARVRYLTEVPTFPTTNWREEAFSPARGWPVSVCYHQNRLVFGGARDLPNWLWFSKTSAFRNFDTGTGLDDEAIEFPIFSDQVNAVRACYSGRDLQIFTSGGEWMVSGDPITPANVSVMRQTRVGMITSRTIPPKDVDGATCFVSRNGRELREFLFTDLEQAYQANDLALLARHLTVSGAKELDYHTTRRLVYLVLMDGTMLSLTAYRQEKVTAWTRYRTDGNFLSIAVVGDSVFVLVERQGRYLVERFDENAHTDAAVMAEVAGGGSADTWVGFNHLDGVEVDILADDILQPRRTIMGDQIVLDQPASGIEVGLPFTHIVEPLPVAVESGRIASHGQAVRLVRAAFRMYESQSLFVDTGTGMLAVPPEFDPVQTPSPIPKETGDQQVRAIGWTRGGPEPLWRVEQDIPLQSTILSVLTEISVNG